MGSSTLKTMILFILGVSLMWLGVESEIYIHAVFSGCMVISGAFIWIFALGLLVFRLFGLD